MSEKDVLIIHIWTLCKTSCCYIFSQDIISSNCEIISQKLIWRCVVLFVDTSLQVKIIYLADDSLVIWEPWMIIFMLQCYGQNITTASKYITNLESLFSYITKICAVYLWMTPKNSFSIRWQTEENRFLCLRHHKISFNSHAMRILCTCAKSKNIATIKDNHIIIAKDTDFILFSVISSSFEIFTLIPNFGDL